MIVGVNLSTEERSPEDLVAAARLAEELGFDFVSSSDHPGSSAASNEVWTQLVWVAAETNSIRLAPRVLGAPFRNAVVVAKMAETLQRLAAGRLVMALGAGGSDDELRAVGVSESHAAAKVAALEEAIRVIHGVWTQPGFTFDGTYHRANGATIEPRPTVPIPIWLGTFGPRALTITGAVADGWIPTLGYASEEQLGVMLARVRSAAKSAGRPPTAIQAILNVEVRVEATVRDEGDALVGPPDFIVQRLAALRAIGFDGFSFIAVGDGIEDQHRKLAVEVVPALTTSTQR